MTPLFALDAVNIAIRSLAVVGGAVIGGLATSGLARVVVRAGTTRKIPPKIRWTLRTLGGLISGWILALFLFGGGGGWGLGGTGGLGLGSDGRGGDGVSDGEPTDKADTQGTDAEHALSSPSTELRIEVLGDDPLRQLAKGGKTDLSHCYRIDGEAPPKLYTLAELRKTINRRMNQKPPLKRIEILLYRDSPGRRVKRVADLEEYLDDLAAARKDPNFSFNVNDKLQSDAPLR